VIVWGSWGLLRVSLSMSMAATPIHIDPDKVRAFLGKSPGVSALHDLHIWPISTTEIALTCHLVMPGGHPGDSFLHDLAADLARTFKINHATFQIEIHPELACALAPEDVV
jgi:cobalt-zinc-cadmium efflux system protein